jgi:hypothetical protein
LQVLDVEENDITELPFEMGKMDRLRSLRLLPNPLTQPPLSFLNILTLMARLQSTLTAEVADGIATVNLTTYFRYLGDHKCPPDSTEALYLCAACGELDIREEDARGRIQQRTIMELPRFAHFREWIRSELQELSQCHSCEPDSYGIYKLGEDTSCGCQMHWDCRKNFTMRERNVAGWDSDEGVY